MLRCLRLVAAALLAILLVACIGHQMLQLAARAFPATAGIPAGAHRSWAAFTLPGSGSTRSRAAWRSTTLAVESSRFRYRVGGQWHTTTRIQFAPIDALRSQSGPVNVHYLPSAPRFAVAAPDVSELLWLSISCVGVPLLFVLLWPGRVARWLGHALTRIPPQPRRGGERTVLPERGAELPSGMVRRRRHRGAHG